jgi:hypothetical protein
VAIAERVLALTGAGLTEVTQRRTDPDCIGASRIYETRKGETYASAKTD